MSYDSRLREAQNAPPAVVDDTVLEGGYFMLTVA
jgi:hypothetical protein